tara:strand:- start:1141 stop:1293 length:153 start_codon:yes stop_codon:yes gene_type:complete
MVEYVLNVIENGELSDVIEGATSIRSYIKDKDDSEETNVYVTHEIDEEYD